MGLFDPIWLRPDLYGKKLERALKAVRRMKDQDKLKEVVLKAPSGSLRLTALDSISDKRVLKEIYTSLQSFGDDWLRLRIVETSEDQEFLYSIAGSFSESGMPARAEPEILAAIRGLTGIEQLNDIKERADQLRNKVIALYRSFIEKTSKTAIQCLVSRILLSANPEEIRRFVDSGNSFMSSAASMRLQKLSETAQVAEPAGSITEKRIDPLIMSENPYPKSAYNPAKAEAAVREISDQKMLAEIAIKAPLSSIRQTAVCILDDEEQLKLIALNDSDDYVKETAVKRLSDPGIIRDLALEIRNPSLIASHLPKMKKSYLIHVAKSACDSDVRSAAIRNIKDQDVLKDIAIGGKEEAKTAVSCISDPAQLRHVFNSTKNEKTKAFIIEKEGGYLCKNCGAAIWPEDGKKVPCVCPDCGTENHNWVLVDMVVDHRDYSSGSSWHECRRCKAKKDHHVVDTL